LLVRHRDVSHGTSLPETADPTEMLGKTIDSVLTNEVWLRPHRLESAPDVAEAVHQPVAVSDSFPTPDAIAGWDERQLNYALDEIGRRIASQRAQATDGMRLASPVNADLVQHDSTVFVDYSGPTTTIGYIPRDGSRRLLLSQPAPQPPKSEDPHHKRDVRR
jgi:hypothetical protein